MPDVVMPRLSDAMQEGTVIRWLKADGDAVQPGDELLEIDAGGDTLTATFEADAGGVLRRVAREGETVALGGLLATVAVDNAAPVAPVADAPAAPPATKKGDVTVEELTRPQQVAARRVAEAKAIVPEHTVADEADVEEALALLDEHGAGVEDLVVKATALALRTAPRANGAYRDGQVERYSRINVGIVVAADGTLAVPTLFDADHKTLAEIAAERTALTERVHAGTIKAPELSGATFTVASVSAASHVPVITAGQAGVLGAGAPRLLPRVVGGEVVPRHVVALTLVTDARIVHGPDAAALLGRIRTLLESPAELAR